MSKPCPACGGNKTIPCPLCTYDPARMDAEKRGFIWGFAEGLMVDSTKAKDYEDAVVLAEDCWDKVYAQLRRPAPPKESG